MIFFFNNSKAYHFCLNQIILSGSLNFKYLNKQIKKTFESTIMGVYLQKKLVKLCEFPLGQKWILKY